MKNSDKVEVATIGKVVGLGGELKLHLLTDFTEQFTTGTRYRLKNGTTIEIEHYNPKRGLVKFLHYNVREDAAVLTNQKLYLTEEESRENCHLEENQYFWFDLIGADIIDNGVLIGTIKEVERIASTDYLVVSTIETLREKGLAKKFYIPYIIGVYIKRFDIDEKSLYTKGALDLLEAS